MAKKPATFHKNLTKDVGGIAFTSCENKNFMSKRALTRSKIFGSKIKKDMHVFISWKENLQSFIKIQLELVFVKHCPQLPDSNTA